MDHRLPPVILRQIFKKYVGFSLRGQKWRPFRNRSQGSAKWREIEIIQVVGETVYCKEGHARTEKKKTYLIETLIRSYVPADRGFYEDLARKLDLLPINVQPPH